MSKSLNSDITKLITKYLSIREHSKLELKNKLIEKGFDREEILLSINEFAARNMSSRDFHNLGVSIGADRIKKEDRDKIYSFLIGRGFEHKMIKYALSECKNEC